MKGRQMRWVLCALFVLGFAPGALAADLDILRGSEPIGPPTYSDWSGFYVGGQVGYVSGGADFAQATGSLIAYLLRETYVEQTFGVSGWPVLGKQDSSTTGFGGFVGYNSQWQDVVLGVEANYTNAMFSASSTDSLARSINSNGTTYDVGIDGTSSITVHDYASLRGRAGYVMGHFMPYAFVGLVVGRADIANSVTVTEAEINDTTGELTGCLGGLPFCSLSDSQSQTNKFIYGYSGGLGLEMALTHNFFLRAEYEYIQFAGLGGLDLYLNNARVGGGFRF